MQRIAILVIGEPRYTDIGALNFREVSENDDYQFDVYIHSWDTIRGERVNSDSLEIENTRVFHNWSPTVCSVNNKSILKDIYNTINWNDFTLNVEEFTHLFGQHHSLYLASTLIIPFVENYEYIIKIRHDLFFSNDFIKYLRLILSTIHNTNFAGADNPLPEYNVFAKSVIYRTGVQIVDDTVFIGKTIPMMKFAALGDANHIKFLCENVLTDCRWMHHTIWSKKCTAFGLNLIPFRNGIMNCVDFFDYSIIRPGCENYAFNDLTISRVKYYYELFRLK